MSRVVVLSSTEDAHAVRIVDRLRTRFGADACLFDTSLLSTQYAFSFDPRQRVAYFAGIGTESVAIDAGSFVWWRRPGDAAIAGEIRNPELAGYCRREYGLASIGAILASAGAVLNHPNAERVARHKTTQLVAALDAGLAIPETLITSDEKEAREFIDSQAGQVIFKANHSPQWQMIDTRMYTRKMVSDLQSLIFAPVIFQSFVPPGRDIRAVVMRERVMAFEARTKSDIAYTDARLDQDTRWRSTNLPAAVSGAIVVLIRRLGLAYGVVDLREGVDGSIFFLEINPSGQFLFLDDDAHGLADAFCAFLLAARGWEKRADAVL